VFLRYTQWAPMHCTRLCIPPPVLAATLLDGPQTFNLPAADWLQVQRFQVRVKCTGNLCCIQKHRQDCH
jgi:hypothetical protein